MGAGHDSVARRYPFTVLREGVDQIANSQELAHVPVVQQAWLEQANRIVEEALEGRMNHHDLPEHAEPIPRVEANLRGFQTYLRETRLIDFWEHLWGYADDSRKYLLFKNLLDTLTPLQGEVPAHFPLALRFPLGPNAETRSYEVGVWLSLSTRLLNYSECQPVFFWTMTNEATEPLLLLVLRAPRADTLAHLFVRDTRFPTLCDLETIGADNAAMAVLGIPAQYGEYLESETATLSDLLDAFAP
jgi:hypothetical protein